MGRLTWLLFPINETALVRWYKNTTRTDEVKLLLQGHSLPGSQLFCASDCSPPPSPDNPLTFPEPEDTAGQARVRQSRPAPSTAQDTISTLNDTSRTQNPSSELPSSSAPGPSSSAPGQTSLAPVVTPATPLVVSRTTEWCRYKQAGTPESTSVPTTPATPKPRKVYPYRICGQAMSKQTGHTQFKGKRYCPVESGQVSQEEWLVQQKHKQLPRMHHSTPVYCLNSTCQANMQRWQHRRVREEVTPNFISKGTLSTKEENYGVQGEDENIKCRSSFCK